MRLFHKDLLSVLPTMQLKGQWRECCLIAKALHDGNLNHILVNRVKDYPIEHFYVYGHLVWFEMRTRGYKCYNISRFTDYFDDYLVAITKDELFDGWHNDRYLRQCLYNLQEKYDAKGIPQNEWDRIVERFGDKFDL